MNPTRTIHRLILTTLILASFPAFAEASEKVQISGSNTAKYEYYTVRGDASASPFPHEKGHFYDELDFTLSRRISPYENWNLQTSGLYNDSDYRSSDRRLLLERFKFDWEKGDGALPFRATGGDVYGYFSYRTLQRTLKGTKMEWQPEWFGANHSLMLVSGVQGSSWNRLNLTQDITHGLSWLVSAPGGGNFSANWAHNSKNADDSSGQPAQDQQVFSVTGERRIDWLGQNLLIEGEAACFAGDHLDTAGTGSGQGKTDSGLFVQASGKNAGPLSYRARFETYGEDFRPAGASVTADRRNSELHLGWRLPAGLRIKGRGQFYTDGQESSNPTDTETLGLNFSAALTRWVKGMAGNIDMYRQRVENRDNTTDQRTDNLNLNLSAPLAAGWNGRMGLLYRDTEDQTASAGSAGISREARFHLNHGFRLADWEGFFEPGIAFRDAETRTTRDRTVVPTLSAAAARGPHRFLYSFTMNRYHRSGTGVEDLATLSHDLRYSYSEKIDTLTFELRNEFRDPNDSRSTDSYRAGITWVRNFDGIDSLLALPFAKGLRKSRTAPSAKAVEPDDLFSRLLPGLDRAEAEKRLAGAEAGPPTRMAGYEVYEIRLLDEFDQRQRLVVAYDREKIRETAILMDLDLLGGPDNIAQIHARVKKVLSDRYGDPDVDVEKGTFGTDLSGDISRDALVRLTEWHSRKGIVRFGIPRRLDGAVRIEIRFATQLPPPSITTWSIEPIQ